MLPGPATATRGSLRFDRHPRQLAPRQHAAVQAPERRRHRQDGLLHLVGQALGREVPFDSAERAGGGDEGAGLEEGAGAVRLGHGGLEEGDARGVAPALGARVVDGPLASMVGQGGVGARLQKLEHDPVLLVPRGPVQGGGFLAEDPVVQPQLRARVRQQHGDAPRRLGLGRRH